MKLFEAIIKRLRTDPFRTKLEPDFKMEWGIERREEPYPSRIKQEVEIFDLKKFVTEEKSKKMANVKPAGMGPTNPFRPVDNSFGTFGNNNMNMPNSSFNSLDIDSMLKDLDEKFKELDRQEAEKKRKQNENLFKVTDDIEIPKKKEEFGDNKFFNKPIETRNINKDFNLDTFKKNIDAKTEEVPKQNNVENIKDESPKINVDSDSKVIGDNIISDDEFFDDFFGDDE